MGSEGHGGEARGLPGGSLVEDSPSSTGDVGSIPSQGTKISHPVGQLSQCIATTEPRCSGAHMPQGDGSPYTTMKIPRVATKSQSSHINK